MPSRFNNIFEREKYVPVIQELPYEALAGLGESMQKEKDAMDEASFKLQDFWKGVKSDPLDNRFKAQLDQEYTPLFNDLSNKIAKGDPNARRNLIELRTKISGDQRFNILSQNYELGKEARKQLQELKGKGNAGSWTDKLTGPANARTQLSPFDYTGHDPRFNPMDDAKQAMSGIGSYILSKSGHITPSFDKNGNPTGTYIRQLQSTGVDVNKIKDTAKANLEGFLGSKGGISYMKDLIYNEGISDKATILKRSLQYLEGAAWNQISQTGGGTDEGFLPDRMMEKTQTPSLGIGDAQKIGAGLSNSYLSNLNLPSLDQYEYRRNPVGNAGPFSQPDILTFTDNSKADNYKPTNFVEKRLLERANSALGRTNTSGKEAVQTMKDWVTSFNNNLNYNIYNLNTSSKDVNEMNNLLFDKGQIKFSGNIISRDEPGKVIPASRFAKDIKDKNPVTSTTLGLINPYGIPYAPVITTSDEGEYYVNNPIKSISDSDRIISDWGRSYFNPGPVEVKMPGSDKKYYMEFVRETNNELTNEGNIGIGTNGQAILYDSDGNIISSSNDTIPQSPEKAFVELYTKLKK